MVCQVRYLSSAGIHRREITGITALERAFPPQWLLYASLQCFPRGEPPIEMDAMVVMDDRVLILELKDFNGKLTQSGDLWVSNRRRFRSSVQGLSMKARKVKSFLQAGIPGFNYFVDFRVVLTGSATKADLAPADQAHVWNLREAESIATTGRRLLNRVTLQTKKAFALEVDFERITRNTTMFAPLDVEWDGHRVVEEDFVVHPDRIWREHRAEQISDQRYKALLRVWAFDRLPPGLNSADRRQLIANRERRAIGRLFDLGSPLLERNAILTPVGDEKDEILTQHFELRRLTSGQTTLDRYLIRAGDDLSLDDRITMVGALLEIVAGLHALGIAHRDLGPRSIWASTPTRLALGGLMTCQMPDEESLGDWSSILRGHAESLPEDADRNLAGSGKQRDVHALGRLAFRILAAETPPANFGNASPLLPANIPDIDAWLALATAADAKTRHTDARIMADEFAGLIERSATADIDQTLIDRHETSDIPFVLWPLTQMLKGTAVYVSRDGNGNEIVVKTWTGVRRGASAAGDIAMTRMFDGVGRLMSTPLSGLPRYVRAGLSPTGPFFAYRFERGTPLEEARPQDLEATLKFSMRLIQCVVAVHAMGHSHGDIAPKNILLREGDGEPLLLDLFDISEVGDGRVRTPALCPDGWEGLTNEQLDRFATTKIVRDLVAAATGTEDDAVLRELARELERSRIETLEPVSIALRDALQRIEAAKLPVFRIAFQGGRGPFVPDNGRYYLRAERISPSAFEYQIAGIERELKLELRSGRLASVRFDIATFTSLAHASQHGVPVEISIEMSDGPEAGFDELLAKVSALIGPPPGGSEARDATPARALDVPRYWRKVLDLEAAFLPEVEIVRDIGPERGPTAIYAYERIGRDFDFDAGSTVDVRLPNRKKVGEVDLEQTDGQRLAVNFSDRRLAPGERVNLVDRRSRTSFDRRTKAVERILEDEAAIDGLVGYFQPDLSLGAVDYGDEVPEDALDRYRLNDGQRRAFRHVIRYGPVGLLQGPPGTGKTHFIASIVHWLTTEKGARRILIASQSHEAVNNAIEAMLDLHKRLGGKRPSLVRIGSKGITEKIRPYHTASLQQRFQSRFESAFAHRVAGLASAVGLKRALVAAAVEIDRTLGERARRLELLVRAETGSARSPRSERGRRDATIKTAISAFAAAAERMLGRPVDASQPTAELDAAFETLLSRHPDASPADVIMARQLIALSRDWSASLATPYRNFEEFLAKTRTIVTATCVGVGQTKIRVEKNTFDWVIVDEAARCTPGELAVPIQLGRRVLLVGDHRQLLPMTERSVLEGLRAEMPDTPRTEFERSDFERAYLSSYGSDNGRTLTEQYRMAPTICDMISRIFYEPHGTRLVTSPNREADPAFDASMRAPLAAAITWIDTSEERGCRETAAPWDGTTFSNRAESEAIMRLLERISEEKRLVNALAGGDSETPIGIICMYSAQKVQIEEAFSRRPWDSKFRNLVRIDTVDSYQGKENTIVIVSLVRCNDGRDQGHVRIPNRCNVALSRAKERLFIVGARSMWGRVAQRWPMRKVLDEIVLGGSDMTIVKAGTLT